MNDISEWSGDSKLEKKASKTKQVKTEGENKDEEKDADDSYFINSRQHTPVSKKISSESEDEESSVTSQDRKSSLEAEEEFKQDQAGQGINMKEAKPSNIKLLQSAKSEKEVNEKPSEGVKSPQSSSSSAASFERSSSEGNEGNEENEDEIENSARLDGNDTRRNILMQPEESKSDDGDGDEVTIEPGKNKLENLNKIQLQHSMNNVFDQMTSVKGSNVIEVADPNITQSKQKQQKTPIPFGSDNAYSENSDSQLVKHGQPNKDKNDMDTIKQSTYDEEAALIYENLPDVTTEFESFEAECPECEEKTMTQVEIYFSDVAYIISGVFFFLCLWCFCWIPFCLGKKRYKLFHDCQHRCPKCYTLIAHQRRG